MAEMAGLEKTCGRIVAEAKEEAAMKRLQAQLQAREIWTRAVRKARRMAREAARNSHREVLAYREKEKAVMDCHRLIILEAAKQEMVSALIRRICDILGNMEEDQYFSFLCKLLERHIQGEMGDIYFSEKDLSRMTPERENRIVQIAEEAGGSLALGAEGRRVENGFLLVYKGLEKNCSFQALVKGREKELRDYIYRELFEEEGP